jgi:glycerol-3-phosphate acyltransferase PlsX
LRDYASREDVRKKPGYEEILTGVFKDLSKRMDYSEPGGAPLVGVDGVTIICHGKSDSRAIKNAIVQARGFVGKDLNAHITHAIEHYASPKRSKEL